MGSGFTCVCVNVALRLIEVLLSTCLKARAETLNRSAELREDGGPLV